MTVSSNRIVKRFYIGGNMDQQAGTVSSAEGYGTFAEAVEAIDAIYSGPNGGNYLTLYVNEVYRIERTV